MISLTDALIRDMRRFQRAAREAGKLHRPEGARCRECRKPWPCPTDDALVSGLHWNGRDDSEEAGRGRQAH
jgi:hypothetical protein